MNKLVLLLFIIFLASCGSIETRKIITKPIEIKIYQPPRPLPLQLLAPHIDVVSHKNIDEFLADLEKSQGNTPTFMAMSPANYEILAANFQEVKRYIEQLLEVVKYYEKMTKPSSFESAIGKRKELLKPTENVKYIKKPSFIGKIFNE